MPEYGSWVERDPAKRALLEATAPPPVEVKCSTCGDARYVRVGFDRSVLDGMRYETTMLRSATRIEPCPDCNAPTAADLVARANIPAAYRGATFDSFEARLGKGDALVEMRAWVDGGAVDSILLRGEPGRGKTHLAVAALRALCERGVAGQFVQATALLDEIKAGFEDGKSRGTEERAKSAKVLVLDDLAAARPTEWARERIATLIEARLIEGRPTVITLDKGADALLTMGYEARLISRLRSYRLVRVDGEDMRGVKR